jgi:ferredoxin-type protein NapH
MNIKTIRRISQIVFFILIIYGGFLVSEVFDIPAKYPPKGTEAEVNLVDAALPVRTCRYIEPKPTLFESCSLKYLFNVPINQPPIYSLVVYLIVMILLYVILARFMCGWMCPLGFVSDMLNYIRQKLKIDRIKLSEKIRSYLKLWRYSFLLFLIFLAIAIALPFFYGIYMNKDYYQLVCQACPARTIIPLFGGMQPTMPTFMTTITAIFSTLSLLFLLIYISGLAINRAWCRICPNGTFTSLFNKGAFITKEKDAQKCTKCGICKRVCPLDNNHVFEEKESKNINHPNCIMCFNCVDKCPEKDCLKVKLFKKTIFKSDFKKK